MVPKLSYGLEKLFGENLCKAYAEQYKFKYSICRLFNVYGSNSDGNSDPNGHVIPDLIQKVQNSSGIVELWGNKNIYRSFTHISDIALGITAVMEKDDNCGTFNIASAKEYSLEKILSILWKLLRKKEKLVIKYIPSDNKDVKRNLADVKKAKKLLNWEAITNIESGLIEML